MHLILEQDRVSFQLSVCLDFLPLPFLAVLGLTSATFTVYATTMEIPAQDLSLFLYVATVKLDDLLDRNNSNDDDSSDDDLAFVYNPPLKRIRLTEPFMTAAARLAESKACTIRYRASGRCWVPGRATHPLMPPTPNNYFPFADPWYIDYDIPHIEQENRYRYWLRWQERASGTQSKPSWYCPSDRPWYRDEYASAIEYAARMDQWRASRVRLTCVPITIWACILEFLTLPEPVYTCSEKPAANPEAGN